MSFFLLFVLGAVIGSFLNVVALRLNTGLSLSGRSKCPHCNKQLTAVELVPIFSFFFLGGRCRECKTRISFQYPLVEFWTGLVFATAFNPSLTLIVNILVLTIFSLYIAITIYDLRHKIIPNGLVYTAIVFSLVVRALMGGSMLDQWAGLILALFFASIWFLSRGRAMGFGDAKLALTIGLLLGAGAGFSAIVLAFWMGALVGVALIVWAKFRPLFAKGKQITINQGESISLKSEIPFAPFMIVGAWLALIFQLDILNVSLFQ
jgi:prepilin signal peptidase PulO-like enzyme (type II secretory pathway)